MNRLTIDGNEACASVAYRLSEVIALYPITPASPMGEFSDAWAAEKRPNLFGQVPTMVEMQSEGGAAGAIHGAIQAGSLATTFTASQGLLLMIPNMYKIAGELTPGVIHVAARALASHALSIFGDHSDVMSTRQTGYAILGSSSVQEAHDLSAVAHVASLESRIPFLHFFDGFRTSHEVSTIVPIEDETLRSLVPMEAISAHRARALSPDHPVIRGTSQNPDVFFQSRERSNSYFEATPAIVAKVMDRLATLTGRQYRPYEFYGDPSADRVVVLMGSSVTAARRTAERLNQSGEKTGVLLVRLFRPFSMDMFLDALPSTVRHIAVLDRTKEPGAPAEPLFLDVLACLQHGINTGRLNNMPRLIGGRYGLSSKEFTPAMAKAVFDELKKPQPKQRFTVGIVDDVNGISLDVDPSFRVEGDDIFLGVFYGLGADGTVSANKNSIKIIGEETEFFGQGYFVYDSKKSGSTTVSHLRFGKDHESVQASWLIDQPNFVAVHDFRYLERNNPIEHARHGASFLINAPYPGDQVFGKLPGVIQRTMIEKQLKVYCIDANATARSVGLGNRISTIMQACFFEIANVLPREQAIEKIRYAIKKTYGKRGTSVIEKNFAAVDAAAANLHRVELPAAPTSDSALRPSVSGKITDFVRNLTAPLLEGKGDLLPVSALPLDGTFPLGTTRFEKRDIAPSIPIWEPDLCIQCNKCSLVCPHAVIRIKTWDPAVVSVESLPAGFKHMDVKGEPGMKYALQISPEDCTGCAICVEVCPAKDKSNPSRKSLNMAPTPQHIEHEKKMWEGFETLPWPDRTKVDRIHTIKGSQLLEPLFEFSGACSGCGETPYVKLVSQLFGDRMLVANATGCSSIYGGNLPTTPWVKDANGRGAAWANSLFEDNAEFGLGMRLAVDQLRDRSISLAQSLREEVGSELVDALLGNAQKDELSIHQQRQHVEKLKARLVTLLSSAGSTGTTPARIRELQEIADYLTRKSVWIIGGDGWGYDIGYGGLDHILATGANVNILLLDTEVYSNTGGQASKATPIGAVAKFAAAGREGGGKDLALQALQYGNVYVSRIAFGASDAQTVRSIVEAERYEGTSLILAYSHCIAHGYDLKNGLEQQKLAVRTGHWPLFRYNPDLRDTAEPALILESKEPDAPLEDYIYNESRYSMLKLMDPERAAMLLERARKQTAADYAHYRELAENSKGHAARHAQSGK